MANTRANTTREKEQAWLWVGHDVTIFGGRGREAKSDLFECRLENSISSVLARVVETEDKKNSQQKPAKR